ncbi:MAG: DUF4252 domain-containing protein [Gammaproteobacteria bacterium]
MSSLARVLSIGTATLALSACGFETDLSGQLGYAAFDSSGFFDAHKEVSLSIGSLPIGLAKGFMVDEPEAEALLEDLAGLQVRIYEIDADTDSVRDRVQQETDELLDNGWAPLATVREEDELVSVLVWLDPENSMRGLIALVLDRRDLVFVNLMGRIDPELLASFMSKHDMEPLAFVR